MSKVVSKQKKVLSGVLLSLMALPALQAAELMQHKNLTISVADDYECGPHAEVRLDAASEDDFHRSRRDMQEVAQVSQTYLWLDCDEIESLSFTGYVDGKQVYQGHADKDGDWYLAEGERADEKSEEKPEEKREEKPDDNDPEPAEEEIAQEEIVKEPPEQTEPVANAGSAPAVPAPPNQGAQEDDEESEPPARRYASAEELRVKADSGDVEAQLDLARAQLDLDGKPAGIDVPEDVPAGFEQLEGLADAGNAEAMQLLSEAYLKHADRDVNPGLIEKVTGVAAQAGNSLRESAAALLTMKAAEQGYEGAVSALEEAGRQGASSAYYSLGMMYLLDKRKKMPYRKGFLRKKLKYKKKLSGRGNVDMGMHFLELAAQGGNQQAQMLLSDMGIDFGQASQQGQSSSTSTGTQTAQAQSPATASATNVASQSGTLESSQVLDLMLADRAEADSQAPASPTPSGSSGSSPTQVAQGSGSAGPTQGGSGQHQGAAGGAQGQPGRPPVAGARANGRSRTAQPDPTVMDSELGDAEIID